MFRKILFVGLGTILGLWLAGCDPRGIKRVLVGLSDSNAQHMTGGDSSDWGG
jgi:hypothetical protein